MNRKRLTAIGLVVVALSVLLFTRVGVFLVFDVVGDIGAQELELDPALAPLQATDRAVEQARHSLPRAISQPSGIVRDALNGRFLVSTDQGELFELDDSFEILARRMVARGPLLLRQGSVEAVTVMGSSGASGSSLLVAGEGVPQSLLDGRKPTDLLEWSSELSETEIAGITYRAPAPGEVEGRLYAVENDSAEVIELTPSGRLVSRWKPVIGGSFEDRISSYCFSGVSASGSSLWIVSQSYSTLFEVDPITHEIRRIVELPLVGEYSDVTVVGTDAYLTVDHDLFEERPPLVRVTLPGPS